MISIVLAMVCFLFAAGQDSKRESRKNLTIKEWKTPARGGARHLDHVTRYDANGRKVEEIEYSQSGLKARCTYEYDESGRKTREVLYDENNKAYRIRKFEYNPDGTKKRQLNYTAKGVLVSIKEFEYITK